MVGGPPSIPGFKGFLGEVGMLREVGAGQSPGLERAAVSGCPALRRENGAAGGEGG